MTPPLCLAPSTSPPATGTSTSRRRCTTPLDDPCKIVILLGNVLNTVNILVGAALGNNPPLALTPLRTETTCMIPTWYSLTNVDSLCKLCMVPSNPDIINLLFSLRPDTSRPYSGSSALRLIDLLIIRIYLHRCTYLPLVLNVLQEPVLNTQLIPVTLTHNTYDNKRKHISPT